MVSVLLRSNPNIIFVGEARTSEVLELIYQAAETGHLTLSTIHVNNVHAVFIRQLGMKLPDYYVYSEEILKIAMAQRLVPKVCPHCYLPWHEGKNQLGGQIRKHLETLTADAPGLLDLVRLKNPDGCEQCKPKKSGQSGRTAICEVLKPDQAYISLQRDSGQHKAMLHWQEHLQGISFGEHGIYKLFKGLLDPRDLTGQTSPIPDITNPNRLETVIGICSDNQESIRSLIEAGPQERGTMAKII